jgi:hypothetical protein
MDDKEHCWHDFYRDDLTVLNNWFWAFVVFVVVVFLYFGPLIYWAKAQAEEIPVHVFEDERVSLKLFAAPCEHDGAKALAANSPLKDAANKLQKAESTWLVTTPMGLIRLDFSGCWVEYTHNGRQGYAVAFEDGEIRFFPVEGFKRTKGQSGA